MGRTVLIACLLLASSVVIASDMESDAATAMEHTRQELIAAEHLSPICHRVVQAELAPVFSQQVQLFYQAQKIQKMSGNEAAGDNYFRVIIGRAKQMRTILNNYGCK